MKKNLSKVLTVFMIVFCMAIMSSSAQKNPDVDIIPVPDSVIHGKGTLNDWKKWELIITLLDKKPN